MASEEHPAHRPDWDCEVCGQPWPCDRAREQLAAEMRGTTLALNMQIYMVNALRENPSIPPTELFERFLSWTRR